MLYAQEQKEYIPRESMPNNPIYSQRIAPRRHGNGANALFLDGDGRIERGDLLVTLPCWDDGDYRPNGEP